MLIERKKGGTESLHPDALRLDVQPVKDSLRLFITESRKAVDAFEAAMPQIEPVIEMLIEHMRVGGRLIYVGAGTSGRLAAQNAAECVPTFGIPKGKVIAIMAGGPNALLHSVEGAEDDADAARNEMRELILGSKDVVCGIAASGTTPFVIAALLEARYQRSAHTVLITCGTIPTYYGAPIAEHVILLDTGPEIIAGSTRLKAGTGQKLIMDAMTSIVFARLGKTYGGLMIDVQATNEKLRKRAARFIQYLTKVSATLAMALLHTATWNVKKAVVMHTKEVSAVEATKILREHDDNLRSVIGDVDYIANSKEVE